MKESKILAVRDQNAGPAEPIMGIPMEWVSFAEVNEAWKAADKDESRAVANRWRKNAAAVIDVSQETLDTSAAMYLGMKAVLKKHGANAITMNCLGGFYGGHIHAYPCLGFHELCNEGLVGACECDVRSTATMVMMTAMTQGRPGYISDPVIDTAKRQIIYAHCVASNKVFGPQGQTNPFAIMTHSEDRQGASRPLDPAAGLHDDHARIRPGPQGDPLPPRQGRRERPGRPGLPDQARRRAGRRHREALHDVGPVGLAPRHLLRRPQGAGLRPGRRDGLQGRRRSVKTADLRSKSGISNRMSDS